MTGGLHKIFLNFEVKANQRPSSKSPAA